MTDWKAEYAKVEQRLFETTQRLATSEAACNAQEEENTRTHDAWGIEVNELGQQYEHLTARLAEVEALLRKYEPEPDKCEHGVAEGDWCEPCNKAYKEAADDAAKGGRNEDGTS